jgi:hypothetical protein
MNLHCKRALGSKLSSDLQKFDCAALKSRTLSNTLSMSKEQGEQTMVKRVAIEECVLYALKHDVTKNFAFSPQHSASTIQQHQP